MVRNRMLKIFLEQSAIGVLTSQSEGLPVALLEYGCMKNLLL